MSKFGKWISNHEEDIIIVGGMIGLVVAGGAIGFKIGKAVTIKKGIALGIDKGMRIGYDDGVEAVLNHIAMKGSVAFTKQFENVPVQTYIFSATKV